MALTAQEQNRLFNYLVRGFAGVDHLVMLRNVFDALFLGDVARRNWLLARIATVKAGTQIIRNQVDARATSDKTALDAELVDLTTLETNL